MALKMYDYDVAPPIGGTVRLIMLDCCVRCHHPNVVTIYHEGECANQCQQKQLHNQFDQFE